MTFFSDWLQQCGRYSSVYGNEDDWFCNAVIGCNDCYVLSEKHISGSFHIERYDRGESFSSDYELNGISLGS